MASWKEDYAKSEVERWSGKNDFEKNILSAGQIALVYFIMTLALLISFVCFSREFLANNKPKQPT